jgi:hypothetical protein
VGDRIEEMKDELGRTRAVAQPGTTIHCRLSGRHRAFDIIRQDGRGGGPDGTDKNGRGN